MNLSNFLLLAVTAIMSSTSVTAQRPQFAAAKLRGHVVQPDSVLRYEDAVKLPDEGKDELLEKSSGSSQDEECNTITEKSARQSCKDRKDSKRSKSKSSRKRRHSHSSSSSSSSKSSKESVTAQQPQFAAAKLRSRVVQPDSVLRYEDAVKLADEGKDELLEKSSGSSQDEECNTITEKSARQSCKDRKDSKRSKSKSSRKRRHSHSSSSSSSSKSSKESVTAQQPQFAAAKLRSRVVQPDSVLRYEDAVKLADEGKDELLEKSTSSQDEECNTISDKSARQDCKDRKDSERSKSTRGSGNRSGSDDLCKIKSSKDIKNSKDCDKACSRDYDLSDYSFSRSASEDTVLVGVMVEDCFCCSESGSGDGCDVSRSNDVSHCSKKTEGSEDVAKEE